MNSMITWSPGVTLDDVEKQVIVMAYRFYRNNKTQTASALGISIRTLDSKLEKYGNDERAIADRKEADRISRIEWDRKNRGIAPAQAASEGAPVFHRPVTRVRLEPALQSTPKPTLPVSERPQVQNVLPKQAAQGGKGRGRQKL